MLFLKIRYFLVCLLLTSCNDLNVKEKYKDNIKDMREALEEGAHPIAETTQEAPPDSSILDLFEGDKPLTDIEIDDDLRYTISANQETPENFFAMLSQTYEVGIIFDKKIEDKITLNLHNASLKEVFLALEEIYQYQVKNTSYGYNITPPKLETKIFMINHLDISRKSTSSTSINPSSLRQSGSGGSTGGGGRRNRRSGTYVTTESEEKFWDNLEETLQLLIENQEGDKDRRKNSADGTPSAMVNRNTGVLVVRAFPHQLKQIQEYLYKTQLIVKRQVILETKILDIELQDQYASGIQWDVLAKGIKIGGRNYSLQGATAANSISTASGLLGNSGSLTVSRGTNFNSVIQLLSTQGRVSVLSSPRVSVTNNQKAVIKVGTDEYYITDVTSNTTTTSGTANTSSGVDLTPFFSGISMDVTPQISEEGEVSLHIHPVVSRVEQSSLNYTVGSQETVLPVARSVVRETDTIVKAHSDQVIIIGGLMENNVSLQKAGLPIDDDSGVTDTLFGKRNGHSVNRELVILLKPVVIAEKTWQNEIKKILDNSFNSGLDSDDAKLF